MPAGLAAPPAAADEHVATAPPVEETVREQAAPGAAAETLEELRPASSRPAARGQHPSAQPTPIGEAIREVEQIIRELRQVLEQMEDVLENLEIAEIQKGADEKEIQTLRRALRQLQDRQDAGREGRRREGAV